MKTFLTLPFNLLCFVGSAVRAGRSGRSRGESEETEVSGVGRAVLRSRKRLFRGRRADAETAGLGARIGRRSSLSSSSSLSGGDGIDAEGLNGIGTIFSCGFNVRDVVGVAL